MDIEKLILKIAKENKSFGTNDVLGALNNKYSRPYVLKFINQLIDRNLLSKSGSTRRAIYSLPENATCLGIAFKKSYKNTGLREHEIMNEVFSKAPFLSSAGENIKSILEYALTEMCNNAIDHSESRSIEVSIAKVGNDIVFIIDDFGIGVFKNVMKKRSLNSELEAIQDLLKGKVTTQPRAHSGEGIFFTSKSADVFQLDSFGYQLRIDNRVDDVFVGESPAKRKGTKVTFTIGLKTQRHLDDVFRKYYTDPDEFAFDKTEVKIRLYTMGSIYVSRSQAKRVLAGLDKFKSIILDFDRVPSVGQAFVDEIFRVFLSNHTKIAITPINMNSAVDFMVKRVEKP